MACFNDDLVRRSCVYFDVFHKYINSNIIHISLHGDRFVAFCSCIIMLKDKTALFEQFQQEKGLGQILVSMK